MGSIFIDPGSPWQNAWIESFNGRLRDEFLNGWRFDNLLEARVLIEDWRIDYNEHRPHGDLTPSEYHPKPTSMNRPQHTGPKTKPASLRQTQADPLPAGCPVVSARQGYPPRVQSGTE